MPKTTKLTHSLFETPTPTRTTPPTVLIAGAGPTGLVLAIWLTRLNIKVRIIDKVAQPGTTSRALAVQARTLEMYRQVGIAESVVNGGVKILGLNLWVNGRKRTRVPLGEIGKGLSPFSFALVFPQDTHEKLLIEKLAELGVHVERETELVSLSDEGNGVRAVLRRKEGAEETFEAAYVAGCDGASSTVRRQIGIGFPGGTYEGFFYVADVHAEGPVTDGELHVDLESSDFVIVFPLKGEGRLRLVGVVSDYQDDAKGEELTFEDVQGRGVESLRLRNVKVNWFSTYRVHHRVADSFRRGRCFLLGDAAHVHSPVGGQGMNTGIGDAVNLAWKLAAVINDGSDESILETYETERIAFARRLVATTDRGFTIATAKGRLARFIRTRVVPVIVPIVFRLEPARRFLFRSVSQIVISYEKSALSEGKAGGIRAGMRLPWVRIGSSDNFEPLKSLKWQVHVYGKARDGVAETCGELGVSLQQFSWSAEARRKGFAEGALYLMRPDGYIALADPESDPARLRAYFARHGVVTAAI